MERTMVRRVIAANNPHNPTPLPLSCTLTVDNLIRPSYNCMSNSEFTSAANLSSLLTSHISILPHAYVALALGFVEQLVARESFADRFFSSPKAPYHYIAECNKHQVSRNPKPKH